MTKYTNNHTYTNANGMIINLRTERYGVAGFDVYATVDKLGIREARGIFSNSNKGEWLIWLDSNYTGGRSIAIRPDAKTLSALLADKAQTTPESVAYKNSERERKQKERAWDNLYNEGAEGYNPYRRKEQGIKDNTPYYKGEYDA